ncbi:MAG: GGDEF domain-containing protein [Lachnospiraceae bacterium]|nr:GGDEF domain-containing protein [Lachnospiraceae bacterium]
MGKLLRIALVISASNFERHRNMILAVHKKIKEMGNYVLYVITNYGVYYEKMDFVHGEPADYSLLDTMDLDGCIMEANLGSEVLTGLIAERIKKRNIPLVTINLSVDGVPSVNLAIENAGRQLLEHFINDHKCSKINLALNENNLISKKMLEVYVDVLKKHKIPFDENRIVYSRVSVKDGRNLYKRFFGQDGVPDGEAVICVHDVCAIGLIMEAEKRGVKVPEDLLIASMNYSRNSMLFRPDITGIDRMDETAARIACDLVEALINGEDVPLETTYEGVVREGYSCGHSTDNLLESAFRDVYQQQTLSKIEMGSQISSMMHFNDSLEKVETMDQFSEALGDMMRGVGCSGYFCCLNNRDIPYILNDVPDPREADKDLVYDDEMMVIAGNSRRTGPVSNIPFKLSETVPVEEKAGDMFMVLPIHHLTRDYGYMVFLNDYVPVDLYNYRICQESIGSSIENLHRKAVLQNIIKELDRLHMQDQMTGLFNRFALKRFGSDYEVKDSFTVVMADMDGLKSINDTYGHLAGNNAICTVASTITEALKENELVIRYGGDEFVILSDNTDKGYWEEMKHRLNDRLVENEKLQKLPYKLGISLGYAVADMKEGRGIEKWIEEADREMYLEKNRRKKRSV